MDKLWTDRAWDDYAYWQKINNTKMTKRINTLIKDIERNGYQSIGKPKQLTGDKSGWWNCRIDSNHRLVFRIFGEHIETVQCKGHYDDN
ncbi:MAG: Txe/YoeB family addiction module toxin [Oscillospiraceae bacterium]|nr:Txe/YoeB family addiction module toxin [Oscillospiraceae bacterium]